jgi:hypothetical protein
VALGVDAVPIRQLDEEAYGSFGVLYPISPDGISKIMNWIAYIIVQRLSYKHTYHEVYPVMFAIERVGRIEFYVEGELFREIDLADYRPRELPGGGGTCMRPWQTRQELGL